MSEIKRITIKDIVTGFTDPELHVVAQVWADRLYRTRELTREQHGAVIDLIARVASGEASRADLEMWLLVVLEGEL